jgi:putative flippase GtrA
MQIIRFAIVGVLVALVYVGSYLALIALGAAQPVANSLAFIMAVSLQYVGQACFTFGNRLSDRGQILRFIIMIGLGFISATLITGSIATGLELSNWVAAVIVTITLPIQNYFIMTIWVFTRGKHNKEVAL